MFDRSNTQAALRVIEETKRRFLNEFLDDEDDEGAAFLRPFLDHIELVSSSGVMAQFPSSQGPAALASAASTVLTLLYARSMSRLPARFREGLGDSFFGLAGLGLGYLEQLREVSAELDAGVADSDIEFLELLAPFFLGSEMSPKNKAFVDNVMERMGARNANEFLIVLFTQVGLSERFCSELMNKSDRIMEAWFADLVKLMGDDD
ncbi:MAG: hypothetical protein ACJ8LG_20510 [Massilia sp.]